MLGTAMEADVSIDTVDMITKMIYTCLTPSGKTAYGELSDNTDGTFTLDVNVSESGTHTVNVSVDGEKIPGSPFFVRILQQADKRNVYFCDGLESGVLGAFDGSFSVHTAGAGPGELKVRISGPKGGVDVKLHRDTVTREVRVEYSGNVAGIYTVKVYWSGEHIKGSPVEVYVAPDLEALQTWGAEPGKIRIEEGLVSYD